MEEGSKYRYANDLPVKENFGPLKSFTPLSGITNRVFHNETYWTSNAIKAIEDNIKIIMEKTNSFRNNGSDIDVTDLTDILNCFKIIDEQQNQIKRRIKSLKDEEYRSNKKTKRMQEFEFLEKYEKRLTHFITSFNQKYGNDLPLQEDKKNIFENIFELNFGIMSAAETILRLIALIMSAGLSGGKSKKRKSKKRKSKRRKSKKRKTKRRKIYV